MALYLSMHRLIRMQAAASNVQWLMPVVVTMTTELPSEAIPADPLIDGYAPKSDRVRVAEPRRLPEAPECSRTGVLPVHSDFIISSTIRTISSLISRPRKSKDHEHRDHPRRKYPASSKSHQPDKKSTSTKIIQRIGLPSLSLNLTPTYHDTREKL